MNDRSSTLLRMKVALDFIPWSVGWLQLMEWNRLASGNGCSKHSGSMVQLNQQREAPSACSFRMWIPSAINGSSMSFLKPIQRLSTFCKWITGIWQHSQFKTTADQRSGLTLERWTRDNLITFPTLVWGLPNAEGLSRKAKKLEWQISCRTMPTASKTLNWFKGLSRCSRSSWSTTNFSRSALLRSTRSVLFPYYFIASFSRQSHNLHRDVCKQDAVPGWYLF